MNPTTSLLWKEWHETRPFLYIGLGVFLGLPLIGGLENLNLQFHRFHLETTPWVIAFGGILAVFIAVGSTCRDFNTPLQNFWQSRPISITRWMLIKYLVGLAVVLTACLVPLLTELAVRHQSFVRNVILLYPFLWIVIYTAAFTIGSLNHRTAHAAMLALAAMLMILFLPMILPPLGWMDIPSAISNTTVSPLSTGQLHTAIGMLTIAAALLTLALLATQKNWQIESGRKMMYGSIASAILILFTSAAFQLSTNLPILLQADLPPGETAAVIRSDSDRIYVITQKTVPVPKKPGITMQDDTKIVFSRRSITLTPSALKIGEPIPANPLYAYDHTYFTATLPNDPDARYEITPGPYPPVPGHYFFDGINLSINLTLIRSTLETPRQPLLFLWSQAVKGTPWPIMFALSNRLYVIGSHLVTLDISEPLKPRTISDVPFEYQFFSGSLPTTDHFVLTLPPIPDLSARHRLRIALHTLNALFEGDTLCGESDNILIEYHLSKLTDKSATFDKVAQYEPTMLERFFGATNHAEMRLQNGLLYLSEGGNHDFNPHITVLSTTSPNAMKPIAHFAASNAWWMVSCPLPNGQALIGCDKIWLVGPPPNHE